MVSKMITPVCIPFSLWFSSGAETVSAHMNSINILQYIKFQLSKITKYRV
jgi:hypothetical protein